MAKEVAMAVHFQSAIIVCMGLIVSAAGVIVVFYG
jgi:hypothetical protein